MKWWLAYWVVLSVSIPLQTGEFPIIEVIEMAQKDNELRLSWIRHQNTEAAGEIAKQIRTQEIQNTEHLKEILLRYGLPSEYDNKVEGRLLSSLRKLVLHSSDLTFQQDFLEKASSAGDLWADDLDLLIDRILLRQGKPQRYGTHFHHEKEQFLPYPMEDFEDLDHPTEETDDSPSFAEYIQSLQAIDLAYQQNNELALRKIVFNSAYDFNKNSEEYLYCASFEQNNILQFPEGFMAFEEPSLAVAFALWGEIQQKIAFSYEEIHQPLTVHYFVQDLETARCLELPIHFSVVPKSLYQIYDKYADSLHRRVFYSPEKIQPITQFTSSTVLEALILNGSKIIIHGQGGTNFEYKDNSLEESLLPLLYFDLTLENEVF